MLGNDEDSPLNSTLERAIGRRVRRVRAGDRHLACNDPRIGATSANILLTSPAFADGAAIPDRHAGVGLGENLSPPLEWSGVPAWTAELVLVMQDPDAPLPRPLVHLIATGIPSNRGGVGEGYLSPDVGHRFAFGCGSFGRVGYVGPRPVRGHGVHRYVFQIFALASRLRVAARADLRATKSAMSGLVLAHGKLTGTYEHQ
jgi:Raf kinase inhibitor-like YbhB/YbcL family protein